jgi:RHH-type proline utilization regulon transcriptional repressor/proline dehydrogenase/delta 1-pyrroline-5-carboxylate dehydrogenase
MTTMGVKLDDATRERIKTAATRIDRTPHWLIKQAIFNYLERLESDEACQSCLPCSPVPPMKAKKRQPLATKAISRSSNSPSRSCRSPSAVPPSPAPTVAPKPTPPMLLEQARLPEAIAAQAQPGVSAG